MHHCWVDWGKNKLNTICCAPIPSYYTHAIVHIEAPLPVSLSPSISRALCYSVRHSSSDSLHRQIIDAEESTVRVAVKAEIEKLSPLVAVHFVKD